MTYCVALNLNEGMVFLSDTRTNAGVDNISRVRKLFTWEKPGECALAIMAAGNLATTQAAITEINLAIEANDPAKPNIFSAPTMYGVAQIVGDTLRDVITRYGAGLVARGEALDACLIVGGQKAGGKPQLFLIYSAGNFIEATEDVPYFQIGEHKYGKPILDRVINMETSLQDGLICSLLSMDSTLRSNLTVGMPLDLAIMRTGSFTFEQKRRIERDDPHFRAISNAWSEALRNAFSDMRKMEI